MKLILDYNEEECNIKLTSDDDLINSYRLVWRKDFEDNVYSVWYNDNFVFEGKANSLPDAVSRFMATIFSGILDYNSGLYTEVK